MLLISCACARVQSNALGYLARHACHAYMVKVQSDDAQLYDSEFLNTLKYSELPQGWLAHRATAQHEHCHGDGEWHPVISAILASKLGFCLGHTLGVVHYYTCDHPAHPIQPSHKYCPIEGVGWKGNTYQLPCLLHDHQQGPKAGWDIPA
jgi:hypothetical protein